MWQVKLSTLCNLRCRYCYEWDRLGDASRIPLERWRPILRDVADHHRLRVERVGAAQRSVIGWHGGEPTLLPVRYVEQVLRLQREVFEPELLASGAVMNAVQTNLYGRSRALALMLEHGFVASVSLDGASGARVTRSGRDAEARVMRNLAALLADGVPAGVALVLGRHNVARLQEIHDRLDALGARWLRLIPMITPPAAAPGVDLGVCADETVAALGSLMRHRRETGANLRVSPLDLVQRTVEALAAGEPGAVHDRRAHGESRFVVHPDGRLAVDAATDSPERVLGNLFETPIADILASRAYAASLAFDEERREHHCGRCRYAAACDQRAVTEYPVRLEPGPCPEESRLCLALERSLPG